MKSMMFLAGLALLLSPLVAQPTVSPPNFEVSLLAAGIPISGNLTTSAVDLFGSLYLVDEPSPPSAVGARVHRVRRDGSVDLDHATGFGNTGQMAHNPTDGLVYLVDSSPLLPVISSRIWRIEPNGGKTLVRTVPVLARGFTIGNDGTMFFGGPGIQGNGLYRTSNLVPGLVFLGPGFGNNRILQSLVSGDVLIADGNVVKRWTPNSVATVPYWQGPQILPNSGSSVVALARTPFNQIGAGATLAVNSFFTLCLCGTGKAITAGLQGQNASTLATQSYSLTGRGLRTLAWGLRQDEYWVTVNQGIVPGFFAVVHRIRQLAAPGSSGSLLVSQQAGLLTMNLFGEPAGGAPFIIGVRPQVTPVFGGGLFIPPFGILDLNPFTPGYLPLLDGLGLFGPPNLLAQIPAGGHFTFSISIPPLPVPLLLAAQAGIVDPQAPNGLFFISNVSPFSLQ